MCRQHGCAGAFGVRHEADPVQSGADQGVLKIVGLQCGQVADKGQHRITGPLGAGVLGGFGERGVEPRRALHKAQGALVGKRRCIEDAKHAGNRWCRSRCSDGVVTDGGDKALVIGGRRRRACKPRLGRRLHTYGNEDCPLHVLIVGIGHYWQTVLVPNKKLRRPGYGERLGFAWAIVIAVLYVPMSAVVKTRYRHLDRLPQQGGAILVVNHVSHIDPFLVAKMVLDGARRPRFLAKRGIFEVPLVGRAMYSMGHIPVDRGTTDAVRAFQSAVDALKGGGIIVLHPEGTVTRDPDGWPMQGKTGAARLASLVPGVPVIPIAQWGVQEQIDFYSKKVKLLPRPRHVDLCWRADRLCRNSLGRRRTWRC